MCGQQGQACRAEERGGEGVAPCSLPALLALEPWVRVCSCLHAAAATPPLQNAFCAGHVTTWDNNILIFGGERNTWVAGRSWDRAGWPAAAGRLSLAARRGMRAASARLPAPRRATQRRTLLTSWLGPPFFPPSGHGDQRDLTAYRQYSATSGGLWSGAMPSARWCAGGRGWGWEGA